LSCESPFSPLLVKGKPSNVVRVYISISGTLSADEWEAAYLYMSFVLRKVSNKHLSWLAHVIKNENFPVLLYLERKEMEMTKIE